MVVARSVLVLLVAAGAALASPLKARTAYKLKDTHYVPKNWKAVASAPASHMLRLEIALKQGQFDELDRHLNEVSDPDHPRYGDHLTPEEVEGLIRPTQETNELVHEWLAQNGISPDDMKYTPGGDWITVAVPVQKAEELLQTKYSVFLHEDGSYLVRTPEWSLPEHLHAHIDTIQPTNSFFRPNPRGSLAMPAAPVTGAQVDLPQLNVQAQNPAVAKACNISEVTPTCLRTLYGTLDYKPQATNKNKVGICNYLMETGNRSDTKIFLQKYRPEAVKAADDFKIEIVNGGQNQQTPLNATQLAAGQDLEGNLDIQTVLGIDYPTPVIEYNTGGMPPFKPDNNTPTDTNEPYVTWLNYVLAKHDLPQAISNSYADDEQTVPESYARRACQGFAQLGARGISVFFGSGDSGVGKAGACTTNDGKNSSTFLADFPASCPYVTTVGGTKNFDPEVAAYDPRNGYVSGGGFSRYFKRPSYQDAAVKPYVQALGNQYKGLYNPNGRAYPDLAAQSQHFAVIWNGTLRPLDGTSAATPTVAAIMALVNDALIAEGKKPLGFLNPWLYKKGYAGLNDITSGNSMGCNTTGFPATKGWDAVTGFGTPNFPKLRQLACN